MNTFSFKKLPPDFKTVFQSSYLLQNLQGIKLCTIFFFILNAVFRITAFFYADELKAFPNYQEHNIVNWMHLLMLPFFYLLSLLFIYLYQFKTALIVTLIRVFTIVFGAYLCISGMLTTFIAFHNPHNSLTFFMIGLLVTGNILVFEFQEMMILSAMIEVIFIFLLQAANLNNTELIYNQIASVGLLTGFYFLSTYIYKYKSTMFLQLEQIKRSNLELERVGKFKNDVLGIVAHDLRNPISAIESIAALVQMDELEPELDENMNMIRTSCEKAREIINDLIETAQNEGDAAYTTTTTNVNLMLEKLVNDWKNQKQIANEVILFLPGKKLFADINTEKFHRVIDNLISNAIKFSDVSKQIEIRLSLEEKQICIDIKDYGIGIPKSLLPNVFERFSKASRNGLRGEKSIGLGLNIVKQIVEKHNGTLSVESTENVGSVFRICLPQTGASFIG